MTWIIARLTFRQLMGWRRLALVAVLAALPSLLAIAYRLGDHPRTNPPEWTADVLLDGVIITILLPLVALIFGTSALGNEIDDGTILHLLAKPVTRGEIIVGKLIPAWLLTSLFVVPSALASGTIAIAGEPRDGIVTGFAVAACLGALVYAALFVFLSAVTGRALLVGLAYVFIWEGIVTSLFSGTRYLSVRQGCLGVADLISTARKGTFEAELSGTEAVVIMAVAGIVSVVLASRWLSRYQVGQSA